MAGHAAAPRMSVAAAGRVIVLISLCPLSMSYTSIAFDGNTYS